MISAVYLRDADGGFPVTHVGGPGFSLIHPALHFASLRLQALNFSLQRDKQRVVRRGDAPQAVGCLFHRKTRVNPGNVSWKCFREKDILEF